MDKWRISLQNRINLIIEIVNSVWDARLAPGLMKPILHCGAS